MKKKKKVKFTEILMIAAFTIGMMAVGYIVLTLISLAALMDGGGSGLILDSIKNPYFAAIVVILALSLFLTGSRATKILTKIL